MITKEMIERINALAKKKKSQGLTELETAEQNKLRRAYLDTIRGRLKNTLENIEIVDDPKRAVTIIGEKDNLKVQVKDDSSFIH